MDVQSSNLKVTVQPFILWNHSLTHLCPVDSSSLIWMSPFVNQGVSDLSFLYCLKNTQLSYANSVDLDQTLCVAASDLGLHCLPMSFLWGINYWVKLLMI